MLVSECTFEMIMFDLVETIHIELSYKTVHFVVPEKSRQNQLLKLVNIADHELLARSAPVYNLIVLLHLHQLIFTVSSSKVFRMKPAISPSSLGRSIVLVSFSLDDIA